jgi:Na+-translocating ferredoxin:NAD+ oxidoreductase subunit C
MTHFIRFRKSSECLRYESPALELSGNAFLPSTAFVPLLQHTGTSANPIVSVGERIHEGQLIARAIGSDSAHVHSPIPGIVQEFRTLPMPDGTIETAVVINLLGSFDILGRKEENYPWQTVPESEILRVLEDKGIINTFEIPVPLVPQLRAAKKTDNRILAVRLFDNDPTCCLDSFLVKQHLDEILQGSAIIARSIDATDVVLVYSETRHQEGLDSKKLETYFEHRKVQTIRCSNRYPSGNTGQFLDLLKNLFDGKKEASIVLVEPDTMYSVYEGVVNNKPMLSRFIVVMGPALGNPTILKVRIGTSIGDVIEECGGFKTNPSRIIVNGLIVGQSVYDLDTPITKYTKSLHLMDLDSCGSYTVRDCIHCGRCLQVCPVGIDPQRISISIAKEKITPKLLDSISTCQHCGCCAIVCPSRIPLHHVIREASKRFKGETK